MQQANLKPTRALPPASRASYLTTRHRARKRRRCAISRIRVAHDLRPRGDAPGVITPLHRRARLASLNADCCTAAAVEDRVVPVNYQLAQPNSPPPRDKGEGNGHSFSYRNLTTPGELSASYVIENCASKLGQQLAANTHSIITNVLLAK